MEDNVYEHIDSKYRLITLVAKRSRQLAKGEQPLVYSKQVKSTSVALQEVLEGKVGYEIGVEEIEKEKEQLERVRQRFTPPEAYVPSLDFKHEKGPIPVREKEKEDVDLEETEEEEEIMLEDVLMAEEGEEEGEEEV